MTVKINNTVVLQSYTREDKANGWKPKIDYPFAFTACCDGPYDYWQALNTLWVTPVDIINIEHDIEATKDHVDELINCKYALCTYAYLVYSATHGEPDPRWCHWHKGHNNTLYQGSEGDKFADFSGIGLCKIGGMQRLKTHLSTPRGWRHLDVMVNRRKFGKWHVHWPAVEHNHK